MSDDRRENAEKLIAFINEGGKTKPDIVEYMELADKPRALGVLFSNLRFLHQYPIETDGVYAILDKDAYETHVSEMKAEILAKKKAEQAKARAPKTPPRVRYRAKMTRFNNTMLSMQTAKERRAKKMDDETLKLRETISMCNHRIAVIELGKVKEQIKLELDLPSLEAVDTEMAKEVE